MKKKYIIQQLTKHCEYMADKDRTCHDCLCYKPCYTKHWRKYSFEELENHQLREIYAEYQKILRIRNYLGRQFIREMRLT